MKILILGSVALPVPPPKQGGTERIAYFQAKGLADRGHTVTLIAAKGSKIESSFTLVEIGGGDTVTGSARVLPLGSPNATHKGTQAVGAPRLASPEQTIVESSRNFRKEAVYMAEVSQWILDHGSEYDVIINNMRAGESLFVPAAKATGVAYTTVMHLPLFAELADFFVRTKTPAITISNAQRHGFDGVRYAGTVYNCVEPDLLGLPLKTVSGQKPYLLMMGSIAPHKNQADGIRVAKKSGRKIILAGKIGNQAYFDTEILPHIDGNMVEIMGELGITQKADLLSGAEALLFPVLWPEPFGLVMIEAMARGTPVVAYANGAVPEVVRDGVTGYIVDPEPLDSTLHGRWQVSQTGVTGLVTALERIATIDRAACRRHVEANFTVNVMIDSLEDVLSEVVKK